VTDDYSGWCRSLFESLAEGGVWGIPRSGLVLQKQGDRLVLIRREPHDPGATLMTPAELTAYQDSELAEITRQFDCAGIEVQT
jgi:hypothetical protein